MITGKRLDRSRVAMRCLSLGPLLAVLLTGAVCCAAVSRAVEWRPSDGTVLLAAAKPGAAAGRPMLVISIDQGLPNEALANGDIAALQRVLDDVKAFGARFDIYALLSNSPGSPPLDRVMQLLAKNRIKFLLDPISSAAITKNPKTVLGTPYYRPYGQEMSVAELAAYKTKYGEYLAGIRVMELFSINFAIHKTAFHGATWANRYREYWPPGGDFFRASVIEPYLQWAAKNGAFVLFSDWLWSFDHRSLPDDVRQRQYEDELRSLTRRYPNLVIVAYANNEPNGRSRGVNWVPAFRDWPGYGAKGFGLSDQDWLCNIPKTTADMNCPVAELIDWARRAYDAGALMVELEPVWYWWNFPRGSAENNYGQYAAAAERGRAKPNLKAFAAAFGVQLPSQ